MSYGFTPPPAVGTLAPGFVFNQELAGQQIQLTLGSLVGETFYPHWVDGKWLWGVNDIRGWWAPAPVATSTITAADGDGVLALPPKWGPRPITIGGWIRVQPGFEYMVQEVLDAFAALESGLLTVSELKRGISRESQVRITGIQESKIGNRTARLTLSLQADDPLRYSSNYLALKNGSNPISNAGTYIAHPLIELTGPHSAITITHAGGAFSLPALAAGQSRVIDSANGDVWNGQTRVFNYSGSWPIALRGNSNWSVSGLGSGTARAKRLQAWR